jgi:hypothetical protein
MEKSTGLAVIIGAVISLILFLAIMPVIKNLVDNTECEVYDYRENFILTVYNSIDDPIVAELYTIETFEVAYFDDSEDMTDHIYTLLDTELLWDTDFEINSYSIVSYNTTTEEYNTHIEGNDQILTLFNSICNTYDTDTFISLVIYLQAIV